MEGMAAGVQDLLVPMGVARDQAAGMSVNMVRLAGDLASFNNVPTTRVLEAMQSALAGSSEPMRRFGVDTRITRLEQIALRDGLIEAGDEMDNAAMAAATMTAIMEDSTDAIGDAARTVDSAANQFRFLQRDIRQLSEDVGKDLLPVARDLLSTFRGWTSALAALDADTRIFILKVAGFAAAAGPLLIVLSAIIKALGTLRLAVIALSGPWGLLVAAAGAMATGMIKARIELEALKQPTDEAADAIERMRQATEGDLDDQSVKDYRLAVYDLNRELEEAEIRLDMMGRGPGPKNIARMNALREQIETTRELKAVEEARMLVAERWPTQAARNAAADEAWAKAGGMARDALGALGIVIPDTAKKADELAESTENAGDSADDASEKFETLLDRIASANDAIEAGLDAPEQYANELKRLAGNLVEAAVGFRIFGAEASNASSGAGGGLPGSQIDDYLDKMKEVKKTAEEAAAAEWNFENTIDSVHSLSSAMRRMGDIIEGIDADLNAGLITEAQAGLAKVGTVANAAFSAMMSGVDQSSKEYEKLERAQQIVNVALGIAAILQQGMGDPYTAIPRMIAMAAMVASLGVDAGGVSGGTSARRQEQQGTGSVLGDADAKSESIEKAIEITADATSQLVGINRGMLHALRSMQKGIEGAATQLARGPDVEFGKMNLDLGTFNNISNDIWDPFGFFSSTKVKDEGIKLLGGAIADMTEGSVAEAFQIVKKKGLFGSSTKTGTAELDDALNDQINLIFESMIDTVTAAGEALGIPMDQIEARIAAFEVAAQEISLKDLDAEEQQAELEAVFSRIFDDLASSVIPFIDQFQKIGEGMGETLVRVATSVQVTQEAIKRLGLSIEDGLGPERMAQVSVGLIEAAGGIDNFISQMESFVDKFAPEAHKFEIAQSDITRALEQMNVGLPETRDGFWDLLQSIDASTEAGQRHIATLLGLTDAADTYYSSLEEIENEREGLRDRMLQLLGRTDDLRRRELETLDESNRLLQQRIWALEDIKELEGLMDDVDMSFLDAVNPAMASLKRLVDRWVDMEEQAIELGASEDQLFRVRRAARAEMARWVSDMKLSTLRLAEDFFSVDSAISQVGSSIASTAENMRDVALRALASIDDWLMSSQLDSNSPLPPVQQLGAAEDQFMAAFEAAMGGDFDALADLPGLADAFLGQAGSFYGTSTDQYNDIWQMVQDMMNQAADIELPPEQQPPNAGQLDTLNEHASNFSSAIAALEEEMSAWQLAGQIDALAAALGSTPAEIAAELGFSSQNMQQILTALGSDIPEGMNLEDHFNDVVSNLDSSSPLLGALSGGQGSITWGIGILEANLWAIGSVLVEIRDELQGMTTMHSGGPVLNDGMHNLQSGEYVVPRNGMLVASNDSGDMSEVKQELHRISRLVERGNDDRRTGLGAVVREEQSTRRAVERKKETVRAA
jgi:hypothetical protein